MNDPYAPLVYFDPTPIIVTWAVFALVGLAAYVWYAFMLSKVFARLGTESWKAWVPILNEAEVFRLGGVPSWSVVFFFLPVVQFYGLYLKAVAASRLNAHFGRGAGSTVLAILLPPVWATLLAQGSRTADPALQERIAPSVAERSGYAFAGSPQPTTGTVPPVPPAPTFPASAPPTPPVPPPAPAAASLPPAGGVPFVPVTPPAPVTPPTPPAPPAPPTAAPLAAAPAPVPPPLAPASPAPAPAPTPPAPPVAAPVVAPPVAPAPPTPPASFAPPVASPPAVVTPGPIAPPPGLLTPPPAAVPPAAPAAPVAEPEPEEDEGDDLDRTVVVDRRPVVPWVLVVDDGPTLRLSGPRVVLGRRPAGAGDGAQELAVPDSTRTLSKVHARLDLADGVWTVTDLHATNGVVVIGADGAEELLEPGASAVVQERFVLGKVRMRVLVAEGDAGR